MASRVVVKATKPKYPKRVTIRVGILDGDAPHEDAGITIGELAATHEFGLGNVPERSFIRAGFDEYEQQIRSIAVEQMAGPAGVAVGAELTAVKAAALFRNRITDGLSPDLAESTKRRKEARGIKPPYRPLIETGVLRSSIVGDVEVVQ